MNLKNYLPKLPLNYILSFSKSYFLTSDKTKVGWLDIRYLHEMFCKLHMR